MTGLLLLLFTSFLWAINLLPCCYNPHFPVINSNAQSSNTGNEQISSARLRGLRFPPPELDNPRSSLHQHPSRSSLDSLSFRYTGCPMDRWCVYWADWSDGSTLSAGEQQGDSVRRGCWSLRHRWKLAPVVYISLPGYVVIKGHHYAQFPLCGSCEMDLRCSCLRGKCFTAWGNYRSLRWISQMSSYSKTKQLFTISKLSAPTWKSYFK